MPLKIGDRVQVRPDKEHDEETKNRVGTVKVIGTPALGIAFDAMPGTIHKWYVEEELSRVQPKKPS